MNKEYKIKEAIKTSNGKLIYVIELSQGESDKIQMYIENNRIYFTSNSYGFSSYPVFSLSDETHKVAKEIFLTYLQAQVKTQILELKQLELVLEALGLQGIIRQTIIDNSSILLSDKEEIIKASIENTTKLIEASNKENKIVIEDTLKSSKKIIKASIKNTEDMIENRTNEIIKEKVRPIAMKKVKK